jgi:hypothetical protein
MKERVRTNGTIRITHQGVKLVGRPFTPENGGGKQNLILSLPKDDEKEELGCRL